MADYIRTTNELLGVSDDAYLSADYIRTTNELLGVSDDAYLSGSVPRMYLPRRIILRNISNVSYTVETHDNSTKGHLGSFSTSKSALIRPLEEMAISIEAYGTIAANIKSRWATMVRRRVLEVYDVAASNETQTKLTAEQVVSIT